MDHITKSISAAIISLGSWVVAAATLSNVALIIGIIAGCYSIYASRLTIKKNKK